MRFDARVYPAIGVSESPCPQLDIALLCVVEVRATPNPAMRRIDVRVYDAADRSRRLSHRLSFQSSLP